MRRSGINRWWTKARGVLASLAILWASDAGLAACSNDGLKTCSTTSDCGAGQKCTQGRCGCASDASCKTGQFCNVDGSCQTRTGCTKTTDCPTSQICDTSSGNCIDGTECTKDVQCPAGQICDTNQFKCVPGCNDPGDCTEPGDICECPNNETSCGLKQCVTGPCLDDSYCQFGQQCLPDTNNVNRCVTDTRGPFCDQCTIEPGQTTGYCPNTSNTPNANFCLLDTTKNFGVVYCGVDCSLPGQTCPWGFTCDDILVLTDATCGMGLNNCPLRTPPRCSTNDDCNHHGTCDQSTNQCRCAIDADCPAGTCDRASGECQGTCQFPQQGSNEGFCTCVYDTDCPSNTCVGPGNPPSGQCSQTQVNCDSQHPCTPVFCKKSTDPLSNVTIGYCKVGNNCAPQDGVDCSQVRAIQQQ